MKERESFGSRLGFILVSVGCAVGLGNVWKFPYIVGENGGAAFVLIYLIFLVMLGLPILICEYAVGRRSRKSIVGALDMLESRGSRWHKYKYFVVAGNYLLMMFYTMVAGWMLYYVVRMASGELQGLDKEGIADAFDKMLEAPGMMIGWTVVVIVLALLVCLRGLQNGVEKVTKVMMLLLIGLLVVLTVRSLTLENADKGLRFYLVPDLERLREQGIGKVIFAAMSHAFFTLSVGLGSMEIFGSYLDKKRRLTGEALSVLVLDTLIALMAGLIIIPSCIAYGITPDSGPSLLFITLPHVFGQMSFGRVWGTCFFIFMSFAALSTVIAVFENIIAMTGELFGWERSKAVGINFVGITVLSIPAILGFNLWSGFQPLGVGSTVMDLEDFLVSYNLLPLGSLLFVLFCMKENGWGFENFLTEVNTGEGLVFPRGVGVYMKYGLPAVISIIYLKGYYDIFANEGIVTLCVWMLAATILLGGIFYLSSNKKENITKKRK